MKASNLEDVGQIRRRKGTSMKRMTKEQALRGSEWGVTATEDQPDSQADNSEGNASDGRKDVGNAECKAQDHAHHASPERIESEKVYFVQQPEESQACLRSSGIGTQATSRHITPLQRDRSSDGARRRHPKEAKDEEFKKLTIDRRYLGECAVSQAVIMGTDRRLPLQQDEGYVLKFRDRNSSASVIMGGWAMR